MSASQSLWSSVDALKMDLSKNKNHLHLLVTMVQDSLRKAKSVKALLYLKTDLAKERMKKYFTDFQNHLAAFAFKFNQDIDAFVGQKEAELKTRNEDLIKQLQMCEDLLANINSVLTDENKCRSVGADIVTRCTRLFDSGFDYIDAEDFHYFNFMPLVQGFTKPEEIGYIRSCDVDLDAFSMISDMSKDSVMTVERNVDEVILVRTNQRHSKELLKYLTVQILDPFGQPVNVSVEDSQNGSYEVRFMLSAVGIHKLHIRVFNVDIKGSPFQIDVIEKPSQVSACSIECDSSERLLPKIAQPFNDIKKNEFVYAEPADLGSERLLPKIAQPFNDIKNEFVYAEPADLGSERLLPKIAQPFNDIKNEFVFAEPVDLNSTDFSFDKSSASYAKANSGKRKYFEENTNSNNNWSMPRMTEYNGNFQGRLANESPKEKGSTGVPRESGASVESQDMSRKVITWPNDASYKVPSQNDNCSDLPSSKVSVSMEMSQLKLREPEEEFWDTGEEKVSIPRQETDYNGSEAVTESASAPSVLNEYIKLGQKKVRVEFLRKVGHAGNNHECLSFPIGVAANSFGDIIACDTRHNSIKVFNASGEFILAIKGERKDNFCRPSAVVVNDRNEIFVKDDRCINVFNNEGNFIREIGTGLLDRPYGLTFDKEGNLIVFNQSRRQPNISLFSQDGQFIRRAPFQPLIDLGCNNTGSKCRFMECVDENVFIVDLGRSVVYVVDKLGNTVCQFGSLGREPGQFNEPSGITKDSSGILLIADSRNNRIQVFTADGVCHGCLESGREIFRPSDIHLSSDGLLYVSNYLHHCVKVFRILPPE